MDTKINIAKILNDKPESTKLWTDMFGIVTLYVVTSYSTNEEPRSFFVGE